MTRGKLFAAAASLAALVAVAAADDPASPSDLELSYREEIERETSELSNVRSQLEKARKNASSFEKEESKILKQLNTIDSDLQLRERLLSGLTRKERRLSADLDATRTNLAGERARLEERRAVLRRRLRNIYKVGERPGLQVLLGASSAVDLVRRFDWLLLVAAQDRMLYDSILVSVQRVRTAEEGLTAKMNDVQAVRRESEEEKESLVARREDRTALLASVQNEKQKHIITVGELEEAEREMQSLIAELERKAQDASGELTADGLEFEAAKGRLPWPVEGKVTRWFGVQKDKRFGTSTFNGGIDIEADSKSDVIAVHAGRADYVDWLPGYGQCIIVNHGGGYFTLYAHTATVFVSAGDEVAAGQVIASVGDTGSLLGDALHFEIRKDAEPINPASWLRSVKLK
ncbi:MAG: murein hydrolase activator EnvC family protein [bacterium]